MAISRTRLIICVDDTSHSSSSSAQTNVHRIYSSIHQGSCIDSVSGATVNQVAKYISGNRSRNDSISKDSIRTTVLGQNYVQQIQDIYEYCSQLSSEQDEVWLFGFGRGGYVVRAVAGLLHHWGAMHVASTHRPELMRDLKKALKDMEASRGASMPPVSTRPAPRIQFVGVFDTVGPINNDSFDMSFTQSIRHMRQALALHEDRKFLTPQIVSPHELYGTALNDYGRSCIQAWFIGQHNDIGGTAKHFGLALYPCQWMSVEARKCGLVFDLQDEACDEPKLLPDMASEVESKTSGKKLWSYTTLNGVEVSMKDFRHIHGDARSCENGYEVKLMSPKLVSLSINL